MDLVLLAQSVSNLPVPPWFGELIFAVIFVLGMAGFVWLKPAVDVLLKQLAATEAREAASMAREAQYAKDWREQVIPALHAASQGLSKALDIGVQQTRSLEQVDHAIRILCRVEDRLDQLDRERGRS